jgi:lactate dehydrogenase-like 2-hydroxyacid dehydrogenase
MEKPRLVVVVPRLPPAVTARIRVEFDAVLPEGRATGREDALALLESHRAEALFFSSGFKLDAAFITAMPARVRIAATSSVGFDHVDVAAARARGLIVTNTPDVLTGCTADLAFTLLLCAARRMGEYERLMRADAWGPRGMGDMLGTRVWGKTLGIIGFGRIGQAVADRARGFGMRILYHDDRRFPDQVERGAEFWADLSAMLPHCDMVTLHCPLSPATRHILDRAALSLLPRSAVVVNAARGGLIDEDALIELLKSGHIGAAGLDVFEGEPRFDRRFLELPNVFLTPHVGSATTETRDAMGHRTLDNIAAVLAGKAPIDPLWT